MIAEGGKSGLWVRDSGSLPMASPMIWPLLKVAGRLAV